MNQIPTRLPDLELQTESTTFANDYIKDRVSLYQHVEVNMAINCAAGGFYMGARHVERYYDQIPMDPDYVTRHAAKAASYYIAQKLQGLTGDLVGIAHVALMKGFKEGIKYRENRLTT